MQIYSETCSVFSIILSYSNDIMYAVFCISIKIKYDTILFYK